MDRRVVRRCNCHVENGPGVAQLEISTLDTAAMPPERITIIADIHGKITREGKRSEPDIHWILEKWLERHPTSKKRQQDILISRGTITLTNGVKTDLISVTMIAGKDIEGYDPAQDQDLYAHYLAEVRGDL